MSEEFNFEEALDFKLNEGRMEEREKRVKDILNFIRKGRLTEEEISEYATEFGYTSNEMKKMAFDDGVL